MTDLEAKVVLPPMASPAVLSSAQGKTKTYPVAK